MAFTCHQHCRQPGFAVKKRLWQICQAPIPPQERRRVRAEMGKCVCVIDGCAALRAEDRSAHRGAAGGRRLTHLTASSSSGRTGKSEESRRNTGKWLMSWLCVAVISFKFTWPAAYLSLEQREKRMERLRAKPPLSLH